MEIKTSKGVYYVNADYTIEEKQGEYSKLTCTIPSAKNKSWIDDCKELDRLYTPGEQDEFVIINPVKITKGDSYGLEITAVGAFEFDFVKSRIDDNLPTRSYTVEYLLDLVFKDTRYSYDLQGTYEKREFTNFGSGSRYKLFLQIMNRFNLEFKVIGKIVRINSKVGNDTSFQFRYLKNIKDTKYSVDATNLVTHVKGYGAYHDANDQSKGRLEVEYLSPLSDIYGKLSGEPVVDERMSISDTLLAKCKQSVESSVAVTVSTTLVALKNQEYRGVARVGDSIWFIDERIDLEKKIRFSTVKSYYDAFDELIKQDVQLGDKDVFSRAQSSDSASQSKLIDMQKELSDQLADVEDAIKKTYVMPSGVNRVFYSSDLPEDVPKGTIKEGDTLFRNIDGETKMYRWDGVQWELVPVVNDVESFKKDIDSQFKTVTETLLKTVTETMQRNDAELEAFRKELESLNLELTEEEIREMFDLDTQSFDDLKAQIEAVRETSRVNAEMIGNDGVTRYNKNLLKGGTLREVALDGVPVQVEAQGGFKAGVTYTISFESLCELLQQLPVSFEQTHQKPWSIVLEPTNPRFSTETTTDTTVMVYPDDYTITITSDWYETKTIQTALRDAENVVKAEMVYKAIADGNDARITGEWAESPTIIFDGGGA